MVQKTDVITLHAPANAQLNGNGAAAAVGNAHNIVVEAVFSKGDGADKSVTLQRNDAAGTGWIALANNAKIWVAASLAASDALVRQANGVAFATGAVNTTHRVIFELNPDSLGLHTGGTNQPCTQIRAVVAGGHANDRGAITAYLNPTRYKGA
jgi:hypothetical protein